MTYIFGYDKIIYDMKVSDTMKKSVLCVIFALILLAATPICAAADYIHGFFRYTVEDESVTITSYKGREEEVTVPAMIGGNPVNVIAAGAFANNENVKTIHLPDTIMTVQPGAFGADQKVTYASQTKKGDINGNGSVNNKDVVMLFRYVSDNDAESAPAEYDVNGDGSVNNKDVAALFRQVSSS